jgi:hypothetical protein
MWWEVPAHISLTLKRYKELLPFGTRFFISNHFRKIVSTRLNDDILWSNFVHAAGSYDIALQLDPEGPGTNKQDRSKNGYLNDFLSNGFVVSFDHEPCVRSQEDMLKVAQGLYQILENILDDKLYLLGDQPTSIDAKVFGQLALHYFVSFPQESKEGIFHGITSKLNLSASLLESSNNASLQHLLSTKFPRLVAYLNRMYSVTKMDFLSKSVIRAPSGLTKVFGEIPSYILTQCQEKLSWASDWLQAGAAIGTGMALLGGYLYFLRSSEEARFLNALQHASELQKQRKSEMQVEVEQNDDEEDEEDDEDDFDDDE